MLEAGRCATHNVEISVSCFEPDIAGGPPLQNACRQSIKSGTISHLVPQAAGATLPDLGKPSAANTDNETQARMLTFVEGRSIEVFIALISAHRKRRRYGALSINPSEFRCISEKLQEATSLGSSAGMHS